MIRVLKKFSFLMVWVLLFSFLSCQAILLDEPETISAADELVIEDNELQKLLSDSPEGGYVLPPIEINEIGSTRVGLKLDSRQTPEIYLRSFTEGTFDPWQKAHITFVEGLAHNAYGDIPKGSTQIQLRFTGVSHSDLLFLFTETFVYEPDQKLEITDGTESLESSGSLYSTSGSSSGVDVTRAQWGARTTRARTTHRPNRITIHHTATPNNDSMSMPARMRQMQNYHMDTLGWADIGYHFLIGQDGNVYQGRAENLVGSHTGGQNTNNIGISFIGNYHSANPSSSVMNGGAKILQAVSKTYGVPINRTSIKGHRDYGGTVCPGNYLYNRMDELLELAKNHGTPTTGLLRGLVYHSGNISNPVAGALVRINTATTDSNGYYAMTLPPGSYTVSASRPGYTTASLSRTVSSGATTWGSMNLSVVPQKGTLRGLIYHSGNTNNRVSGATIRLNNGASTTSDSNGNYSLSLNPGVYTVSVSANGFTTQSFSRSVSSNTTTWGSANLAYAQVPGILSGVIYHSGNINNRVSGATVRLNNGMSATSDSNGFYSFSLQPGTYGITVSKWGFKTASITRSVSSGNRIWGSVNLSF